eukprot:UN04623
MKFKLPEIIYGFILYFYPGYVIFIPSKLIDQSDGNGDDEMELCPQEADFPSRFAAFSLMLLYFPTWFSKD